MAAVIAHEVKNPLAAVRGAIQVVGGRLPDGAADGAIIREIIARLDGLNDLIQDLLVFARPPEPKMAPTDLRALLSTVVALLKRDPALADLGVTLDGEAAPVSADPNLFKIVFQNLLINSAQAMRGRGTIAVSVSAADGRHRVEVADHGPGIPSEIRAALFRPFKTTKARGTGLGMATAKRLVELQGGTIAVRCPDGGGTVVTVEIPSGPGTEDRGR
jgi:signal transduction histidine kinase